MEAASNEKRTRGPCCFAQLYTPAYLSSLKNLRIAPSAGFLFFPKDITQLAIVSIQESLPEDCQTIMLHSQGIVRENKEIEVFSLPIITCAFLPHVPTVRIKSFKLAEHSNIQQTVEYQKIISTIVNCEISGSTHETSACLMLFCNVVGITAAKRWASAIQKSKESKIVSVWGGVVQTIYAPQAYKAKRKFGNKLNLVPKMYESDCVAIVITGPVQTWSTILERKCNTKERVEERLKLFKDEVKLKKHSVGFMFACNARGTEMFDEAHVESTIFKRLFPKVPLVGCFGYGEFGKTTIDEEKSDKEEHKYKKSKSWYNEFSTVFLILTYD
ncbi:PREDICTED: uncharacterized protein LOC105564258 isoform X2 [Vollenhovia emeryi]|nr:PREDICTED: uncharacterized protein LOC105564258 isoform X2 [Vollenhovia emeryi]